MKTVALALLLLPCVACQAGDAGDTPGPATGPSTTDALGAAEGAVLYARWCVACHGAEGRGDGITASRLSPPPADLAADAARVRSDEALDAVIAKGGRGTGRPGVMPAFGGTLADWQRRDIVTYVRRLTSERPAGGTAGRKRGLLGLALSWFDPAY